MDDREAAKLLHSAGFAIPEPFERYVKKMKRIEDGICQVWRCPSKKSCGKEHEYFIPVTAVFCSCGSKCFLAWENGAWKPEHSEEGPVSSPVPLSSPTPNADFFLFQPPPVAFGSNDAPSTDFESEGDKGVAPGLGEEKPFVLFPFFPTET